MTKKKLLKKIKYGLRFLPDKLYIQIYYFGHFKHFCNLKEPATYNEKLNWLKLHDRNPEYTMMVDKYEAKKYAVALIDEEFIVPTLGVWDSFEEIDFDKLPAQFVLKCTHDSEGVVIVKDKNLLDRKLAKRKLKSAMKYNFYYIGREWPYKNIKPRIIAEKYLEDRAHGSLNDYKFFCFDGVPKAMFIASDRGSGSTKFDYFDMSFNHLKIQQHYPNAEVLPEKPKKFDEMIKLAQILSKNLPHVRVDFYEADGNVYFGELTFYHFSGFMPFCPEEWDQRFGDWLRLPPDK